MKNSLSNRLLLILLILTLCVWGSVSSLIWVRGTEVIQRQIDNQLRILVLTASHTFTISDYKGMSGVSRKDVEIVNTNDGDVYLVKLPDEDLPLVMNVWENQTLVAMTKNSPLFKPPHQEGFSDNIQVDGTRWRVIRSRLGETNLWLVAGLNKDVLASESRRLLFALLSPLLAGMLLITPLLYYAVRSGLKPLRNLEQQISQRGSDDLHPVEDSNVPIEVEPMVGAINKLLLQLEAAIEKEKGITADATHELQSPLAAIKTEVQLALSLSSDEHKLMLTRIIERVNRASHAVKQLTALSRLESTAEAFKEDVSIISIVEQVLETHSELQKQQKLTVDISGCCPVIRGNGDMITILMDNLIRNAFNYAQQNSQISIQLTEKDSVQFVIENHCREFSDEEWQQITRRFYRVPGSRGSGSGLGMSIAQRICELHAANFQIGKRESGCGFSVKIEFPQIKMLLT